MQIAFLFLGPDHIHDLPVFREAGGTVSITFRVTLKAVLVEGVTAEKVDRGQLQGTVTDAALGLLEDLRTAGKGDQKGVAKSESRAESQEQREGSWSQGGERGPWKGLQGPALVTNRESNENTLPWACSESQHAPRKAS